MKLEKVKTWHYQLQGVPNSKTLTADLLVIDIDQNPKPFLIKPDGTPRAVAAYLSVGEAEDYRAYWKQLHERNIKHPVLLPENKEWKGNYPVRFWDAGWQEIILNRVHEAKRKGFTALYLDKVDVYDDIGSLYPKAGKGVDMEREMIKFIARIAHAEPTLDVIQQNADGLLEHKELWPLIAGIGREDLWFGEDETGEWNDATNIRESIARMKAARIPVFVIEYLDDARNRATAARLANANGWPIFFDAEDRELDG